MLILQVMALTVAMSMGPGPAASSASKDERVAAAYQQFEKQRHVEAALEFEGLWRDFKEPRFLFNAAVTRYTARHYAHAVAYLNEYLAQPDVKGPDWVEAEAQLEVARREVTNVDVRVHGAPAGVSVSAVWVSQFASDLRPALPVKSAPTAGGQSGVVELDPGTWTVRAEAPGFEPAEVQMQVTRGAPLVAELALKEKPQETGPQGQVDKDSKLDARKLALATMGAGGGLTVVGVVLTAVGQAAKFGPAVGAAASACAMDSALIGCSEDVRGGLVLRGVGAGLLGTGLGFAGSGAIWLIKQEKTRRLAWFVEAGVGGAVLIGGIAGLVVGAKRVNEVNATFAASDAETWAAIQTGVKGPAGLHTASAALVGLGVGLASGAALGLGLSRGRSSPVARALRFGGPSAPGVVGLSLAGRF